MHKAHGEVKALFQGKLQAAAEIAGDVGDPIEACKSRLQNK
jgi:hypothetical protein